MGEFRANAQQISLKGAFVCCLEIWEDGNLVNLFYNHCESPILSFVRVWKLGMSSEGYSILVFDEC